jgi:hypothetical protein
MRRFRIWRLHPEKYATDPEYQGAPVNLRIQERSKMPNSTRLASANPTVQGNGTAPPSSAEAGDAFDNLNHIRAEADDIAGAELVHGGTADARAGQGDVFDNLDEIRIDPSAAQVSTTKQLLAVRARKPKPQEFIRVHPEPAMSIIINGYHDDDEREHYLVLPGIEDLIKRFVRPAQIVVCVNRQGSVFLWPVPLPSNDRRSNNAWTTSARAGMELAKKDWISLRSDMDSGCYEADLAQGKLPEPIWPDKTLGELLRLAYGKKIIDSPNHPKVRDLLGMV